MHLLHKVLNTELHCKKINVHKHQKESCSDPFTVPARILYVYPRVIVVGLCQTLYEKCESITYTR